MIYWNHWRILWISILDVCVSRTTSTLLSRDLLRDLGFLTKPFGVELAHVLNNSQFASGSSLASRLNPVALNCSEKLTVIESCNRTSFEFVQHKSLSEKLALEQLRANCSFGRYECIQDHVLMNEYLRTWIHRLQATVKTLCVNRYWEILLYVDHQCLQTAGENQDSDLNSLHFVLELMVTLCEQPSTLESTCASKFLEGLQLITFRSQKTEPCNVTNYVGNGQCSSACDEEVGRFYEVMGCCVGLVTSIMEKYKVLPANGSFGALISTSARKCHGNYLTCPEQEHQNVTAFSHSKMAGITTTPTTPTTLTVNSTNSTEATGSATTGTPKGSSPSAKLVAGICVAVIIGLVGVAIVTRYVYQKIQNRQKIRFEDYGYSQLKMMEDALYEFEEEEHDGLISL